MDRAGAPLGEISARLGHSNEKITSTYLKQLRSEENPYVGRLVARLGVKKE
jgi:integrase